MIILVSGWGLLCLGPPCPEGTRMGRKGDNSGTITKIIFQRRRKSWHETVRKRRSWEEAESQVWRGYPVEEVNEVWGQWGDPEGWHGQQLCEASHGGQLSCRSLGKGFPAQCWRPFDIGQELLEAYCHSWAVSPCRPGVLLAKHVLTKILQMYK